MSLDSPVQSSLQGGQPLCPSKKRVMPLHQRRLEREGLILAGVSPTAETEAYKVISVHLNEPLNMMLGTILCFVLLLNVKFCYVFFSFLFFFFWLRLWHVEVPEARDGIQDAAVTYATTVAMPDPYPTVLGWGSNLHPQQ